MKSLFKEKDEISGFFKKNTTPEMAIPKQEQNVFSWGEDFTTLTRHWENAQKYEVT